MPAGAVEATVKVRIELPEPGAAIIPELLKPSVTPVGRELGPVRVIAELKPFNAAVVIVDVPKFPWLTLIDEAEAEMEKLGVGGPDSALIRAVPFGLPQPVTKS